MLKLFLQRKAFYIALLGVFLLGLLMWRSCQKPAPGKPMVESPLSPYEKSIAASGIVEAINENIRLAPAVGGLVKNINVQVGAQVKANQVLIELDDRNLMGQLGVQKARLKIAESKWNKIASLSDPLAISKDERDTSKQELELAKAEVRRLEMLLDQLSIKAPLNAEVLQVNTRKGEYINTPINSDYTPPLLLAAEGAYQIRADVDEVNALKVKEGVKALGYLKGSGKNNPIELDFVRIDPYVIPKKSLTGDNSERVDTRVLQVIFKANATKGTKLYVGQQLDLYLQAD